MRLKCVAVLFNRYMLRIIDYNDNMRSSRRVLCVASQIINSSNGLSCKLHNVIFGIFHYQYFMCYNIYIVWFVHDWFTITVRQNNIDWTNAIDKEAIIRISVSYGVDLKITPFNTTIICTNFTFWYQNHMIKLCYLYQHVLNIVVMTEK